MVAVLQREQLVTDAQPRTELGMLDSSALNSRKTDSMTIPHTACKPVRMQTSGMPSRLGPYSFLSSHL